ncbi:MAG: hypothetical protein JWM88_2173 [Verrucomicrobia bacterium]|nr:hypothetical protein [Verrucomicrobiota bacterium]
MEKIPSEWRPLRIVDLKGELAGFDDWVLCGGYSVALVANGDTRDHGDIDIGVFRSEIDGCLHALGKERVFLCVDGKHVRWSGETVPAEVHDIWITDTVGKYWVLQVMLFDDEGDFVVYRRDRRIRWSKRHHSRIASGIRVLNPFVTLLFKTHKPTLADKEVHDVIALIESGPEKK